MREVRSCTRAQLDHLFSHTLGMRHLPVPAWWHSERTQKAYEYEYCGYAVTNPLSSADTTMKVAKILFSRDSLSTTSAAACSQFNPPSFKP